MDEEVKEVLKQAKEHSDKEFDARRGDTFSKVSMKDSLEHGRMSYHLRQAENNAIKEFYKKSGQNFNSGEYEDAGNPIVVRLFLFASGAFFINLFLYFPIFYLSTAWGGVNRHDAVYITIIINTLISTIIIGLYSEFDMKRKAFIAGMRAEAENRVVGKYHEAKKHIDLHHASKGNIFDHDSEW